ncbi:hypothetical protein JL720_14063 [Aureococcus anophagefferens]|nr:hypothetical protein JL720_14063 [Aureococcus anophagefferens]
MVDSWGAHWDGDAILGDTKRSLVGKWAYDARDITCPARIFQGEADLDVKASETWKWGCTSHEKRVPFTTQLSEWKRVAKAAPQASPQAPRAAAIAHISDVHAKGGDFVGAAADAAGELYAYGHGDVLLPTKAAEYQFRPTAGEAMSHSSAGPTSTAVEYTFGYKRCEDDEVRIFLHHSSVPYAA